MTTVILTLIGEPGKRKVQQFNTEDKCLEISRAMCAEFQLKTLESIINSDGNKLNLNNTLRDEEVCMGEILVGTPQAQDNSLLVDILLFLKMMIKYLNLLNRDGQYLSRNALHILSIFFLCYFCFFFFIFVNSFS